MRRRTFLWSAMGAGWLAGQPLGQASETLAWIAPDGLWLRNLPEGAPVALAHGPGLSAPRISPSGAWILYRRGEIAWVAARDGSRSAQLGAGAAQWRPDRDELLLEQPPGLRLFGPANRWSAPLRSIPGAGLPAAFRPHGRELIFGQRTDSGEGLLRRVSLDAAAPAQTIASRPGDGLIPSACAGDTLLYWLDPSFSASCAADGLELFRLPASGGTPQPLGVATLLHDDFLALSPDGRELAVTAGQGRESWHEKRIALIDAAAGRLRYLTGTDTAAICPSWSPDGARLAYVSLPENLDRGSGPERLFLGRRRIWTVATAGPAQPVRLTGDGPYRDEQPLWLADGRHILFGRIERGSQGGTTSIWLMDSSGGGATRIAGPLATKESFEGEDWFGYYGTIDWRAVMDFHSGRRTA